MLIRAIGLAVMALAGAQNVASAESEEDFMLGFLVGHYDIVGRYPDGGATYTGALSVIRQDDGLRIERHLGDRHSIGIGRLVRVTADAIPTLQVSFREGGSEYQASYLWSADLDNYARVSGYIVRAESTVESPGLEVWFARR